jgi:hypothetical protein
MDYAEAPFASDVPDAVAAIEEGARPPERVARGSDGTSHHASGSPDQGISDPDRAPARLRWRVGRQGVTVSTPFIIM